MSREGSRGPNAPDERARLIARARGAFREFGRPGTLTLHGRGCQECGHWEKELSGADAASLTPEMMGVVSFSPLFVLTPEALGHFLPRLLEFALEKERDADGEPFAPRVVARLSAGPECLPPLSREQREVIREFLNLLSVADPEMAEEEGLAEELEQAAALCPGSDEKEY